MLGKSTNLFAKLFGETVDQKAQDFEKSMHQEVEDEIAPAAGAAVTFSSPPTTSAAEPTTSEAVPAALLEVDEEAKPKSKVSSSKKSSSSKASNSKKGKSKKGGAAGGVVKKLKAELDSLHKLLLGGDAEARRPPLTV